MDDDEDYSHLTLDQQEQRDEMTALDNILNDCTEATSEAGGGQRRRVFSYSVVAESGGLTGGRMDAHLAQVEQVRQEQDGRCHGALGIPSFFLLYLFSSVPSSRTRWRGRTGARKTSDIGSAYRN